MDDLVREPAPAPELLALREENAQLRAALSAALPYLSPPVDDLVREYSDLDGTDVKIRERNRAARELHDRVVRLLTEEPS